MVIAAALKAGAHFTVSKQTKRNSKWTMACGIVDQLITSLVLLSSGFHGSPVRTESLDGGWDLEPWAQGSALVSPPHTSAPPSPSIRAAWTDCRALLVPSESRFCFPRMTTLPPGLTFFSMVSHTATIPMAKDKQRNSSTWGFPLLGRPFLHIL